jgi:hypothetical protein
MRGKLVVTLALVPYVFLGTRTRPVREPGETAITDTMKKQPNYFSTTTDENGSSTEQEKKSVPMERTAVRLLFPTGATFSPKKPYS